jgi:hypothetical protein
MGMHCHFYIKDLPGFNQNPSITYHFETTGYTYTIPIMGYIVDCDLNGNAWFDVGSCSTYAMNRLKYLIENRVPFTCS